MEDLLTRARLVCSGFARAIDASLQLRRRMFLAPDHSMTTTWFPFLYQEGRDFIHLSGFSRGCNFHMSPTIYRKWKDCTGLDRLLAVQPPMRAVDIDVSYRDAGLSFRYPTCTGKIRSSDKMGLTVGEILKKLDEMFSDYTQNYSKPDLISDSCVMIAEALEHEDIWVD